jgi:hypothetical protein
MIEIILEFEDGDIVTVKLQSFTALEWRDNKRINGSLRKQGAKILKFIEIPPCVCLKEKYD